MKIVSKTRLVRRIGWHLRPGEKDCPLYEILRKSRLYLPVEGSGKRARFANVFRQAWAGVPPSYRATMLDYWQRPFADEPWLPQINSTADFRFPGACESYGRHLSFNSTVTDLMPANVLSGLIAHELSHAWHCTLPSAVVLKPDATLKEKEDEADHLAAAWGFNVKTARAWANDNRDAIVAATGNQNTGW